MPYSMMGEEVWETQEVGWGQGGGGGGKERGGGLAYKSKVFYQILRDCLEFNKNCPRVPKL